MSVSIKVHLSDPGSPAPRGTCWKLIYDPCPQSGSVLARLLKEQYPAWIQAELTGPLVGRGGGRRHQRGHRQLAWAFGRCQCGSRRAGSRLRAGRRTDCVKVHSLPCNLAQRMCSLPSVFLLFGLCHPKLDDAYSHLLHLVVCGIMPTQLCASLG